MKRLSIVDQARAFAIERHGEQRYGNDLPYEWHIGMVATLAKQLGYAEAVQAAGWLHETVEDTHTRIEEIHKLFGERIADMVDAVTYTDFDTANGVDKIVKARRNLGSHVVKFCDASVNFSASTLYGAPAGRNQWATTVDRYGSFIARLQPDLPTPAQVSEWLAASTDR